MPGGIDVAVIIQYGFGAEENQVFVSWDKLLYIQAGLAAFLHEIFAVRSAVIFRLVGYRGPDEAVFVACGPAEIIDSQGVYGAGCLCPCGQ